MGPQAEHEVNIYHDISPSEALRAIHAHNDSDEPISPDSFGPFRGEIAGLSQSISSAAPSDRAFSIKVAESAIAVRSCCQQLEAWYWPGSFELATALAPASHGAATQRAPLPPDVLVKHEHDIRSIRNQLAELDMERQKALVLDAHSRSPDARRSDLDELTAITTAIILQTLPYYARLQRALDLWSARLAVIAAVPDYVNGTSDTRAALKVAWFDFVPDDESVPLQTFDSFEQTKDRLSSSLGRTGKLLDYMLDALEGHGEKLPDQWIDNLEDLETEFAEWCVAARSRLLHAEDKARDEAVSRAALAAKDGFSNTDRHSAALEVPNGLSKDESDSFSFSSSPEVFPLEKTNGVASARQSGASFEQLPDWTGTFAPRTAAADERMRVLHRRNSSHEFTVDKASLAATYSMSQVKRIDIARSPVVGGPGNPSAALARHRSTNSLGSNRLSLSLGGAGKDLLAAGDTLNAGSAAARGHRRSSSADWASQLLEYVPPAGLVPALAAAPSAAPLSITTAAGHAQEGDFADQLIPSAAPTAPATAPTTAILNPLPTFDRSAPLTLGSSNSYQTEGHHFAHSLPAIPGTPDTAPLPEYEYPPAPTPAAAKTPQKVLSSPVMDDRLEQKIDKIIESLPAKIDFQRFSRRKLSGSPATRQAPSRTTPSPTPFKRDQNSSPGLTLKQADQPELRAPKSKGGDSAIRLYYLSQPGRGAPIKLYIRLVGEDGERVMVRVGGGWADLRQYLEAYAAHHTRAVLPSAEQVREDWAGAERDGARADGARSVSSPADLLAAQQALVYGNDTPPQAAAAQRQASADAYRAPGLPGLQTRPAPPLSSVVPAGQAPGQPGETLSVAKRGLRTAQPLPQLESAPTSADVLGSNGPLSGPGPAMVPRTPPHHSQAPPRDGQPAALAFGSPPSSHQPDAGSHVTAGSEPLSSPRPSGTALYDSDDDGRASAAGSATTSALGSPSRQRTALTAEKKAWLDDMVAKAKKWKAEGGSGSSGGGSAGGGPSSSSAAPSAASAFGPLSVTPAAAAAAAGTYHQAKPASRQTVVGGTTRMYRAADGTLRGLGGP